MMKFKDWRSRVTHRLRGHGKPEFTGSNPYTDNYTCSCGAFLWRTRYWG